MQFIKYTPDGATKPYGLSRDYRGGMTTLRLPLFIFHGRRYQIATDEFATGWHVKDLYLRFGTANLYVGA